jgi:SNF2 family DNA or RNA helicase
VVSARLPRYPRGRYVFKGSLYPYQQESVDKMIDRGQVLLGLVMGAGKTVTTIATVEKLIEMDEVDKCLVVVPASLKYQWMREINKFTDSSVIVVDGTPKARDQQWKRSLSAKYTIVNPESLIRDGNAYKHLSWQCIIVDEATLLKSRTSKRSRMLKRLAKPIYYRYALTGQPIENRPEELFSIMEFVDASILGKFDLFDRTFIVRDHFGKPTRYKNLKALHESLTECMIRKTREDIADQLPKIIHQVIPVAFDKEGASLYKRVSEDLLQQLQAVIGKHGASFNLWRHYNDTASNEAQGQVMTRLTALRMLCDNPELVKRSAMLYADPSKPKEGSQYASELVNAGFLSGLSKTPKLDAVVEYITDVLDEDPKNKVVLFSFFKENLRLIQRATSSITNSVLFMGGMSAEDRDKAKQRFSTDPNTRLFLSSDAGGYGVDLPMANYLISYDLPWSSGKLEQREARIIRLSSTFPHVTIATFVMRGSIEERQYEMLQQKKSINEAFVDGKHHDVRGGFDITLGSLSAFLRDSNV